VGQSHSILHAEAEKSLDLPRFGDQLASVGILLIDNRVGDFDTPAEDSDNASLVL
jgi:hypothetical protein